MKKRILLILLAIGVVAQFFQPDRSVPPIVPANDMLVMTQAPDDIKTLVQGACYDCHSDNSTYPWYASITPVNFWLQDHINEGRGHMNFSRWNDPASQEHAHECGEVLQAGEMPPSNYAFIHGHAKLDAAQRSRLVAWFNANMPKKKKSD
ncbi:MAG: heme-binding domain-containing protein [Flavobacteriales bacterium]|jgi:hypothetical protein|nr:heme-binding domain-containing protein [Flavobacteriales bacterium]MBP6697443.1 heme-binding domain-containing protein [Flavobacteriales bacterium]MBP7156512.1 heme-binding domain-containing protein [Flavobacteriales bacterium]HQV75484.1 heme-binding domain-containing protein [Flavobacteriales bacterium]HQW41806.1 heme-binding domain-containing protein [Flavobacteriales bacterium]